MIATKDAKGAARETLAVRRKGLRRLDSELAGYVSAAERAELAALLGRTDGVDPDVAAMLAEHALPVLVSGRDAFGARGVA